MNLLIVEQISIKRMFEFKIVDNFIEFSFVTIINK